MRQSVINQLQKSISEIYFDVSLKKYNTFHTGGNAAAIAIVKNLSELKLLLKIISDNNLKHKILGMGSNLLFSDEGYNGVLFKLDGEFKTIDIDNNISGTTVRVGAGVGLVRLVRETAKAGLSGLEFACSIPGTVGGAIYMNAGAHGEDISMVVNEIHTINMEGKIEIYQKNEINWQYRHGFRHSSKNITTILNLTAQKLDIIKKKIDNYVSLRIASQPKGFSAGSVFRNPEGYKAYKLVIDTGFQRAIIGDAIVSEKHANFILNRGNATSSDIYRLISKIQNAVFEKFGVELKTEIEFVGEFDE